MMEQKMPFNWVHQLKILLKRKFLKICFSQTVIFHLLKDSIPKKREPE